MQIEHVRIHGYRRAYVRAGSGPALLLLHGLGCDHTTWDPVIESLSRRYTVIAPDLLGHGESDKPRADYSVGGYANGMRDLLSVLGIDRVTVVGHSLGGGVAMQFAYQFPERTERLVLVAPGGFGPEVTPLIRVVTTPGFHQVAGLLTLPGVLRLSTGGLRLLSRLPVAQARDLGEVADVFETFADSRSRAAIRHVVRAVVDWKGQVITMTDRAYLTEHMPICIIWGSDDMVIPVRHAETARAWRRGPDRGRAQRRALPAQGPPAAVRQAAQRLHPLDPPVGVRRRGVAAHPALRRRPSVQHAEAGERPIECRPGA